MPPGRSSRAKRALAASGLALAAVVFSGCKDESASTGRAQRPVPVVIAAVEKKDVPIEVRAVGTVEAISTVSIIPQVGGVIQGVHFKEGDLVRTGDLLFTIDTRPYRASLSAARASLEKNRALADEAQRELTRVEKLAKEGIASAADLSRARANADSLGASLNADRANVTSSSLNVQFAQIRAPISGRTGSLLVHAGNVVRANDERALVVLRSTSPIYVRFAVPEQFLSGVRQAREKGPVPVLALPRGMGTKETKGELSFIENTVDAATGKIDMKGKFDNEGEPLWPGQFVDVTLRIGFESNVVVVPEAAVQTGQDGSYAFVVDGGNHVTLRRVNVVRTAGTEVVVDKGLEPGERVVTDGQVRLRDGSAVEIKPAPPPHPQPGQPQQSTSATASPSPSSNRPEAR